MMTESELNGVLYELSVKAINELSGDTIDPITVQEAIERNSYSKPILYCVQIVDVHNITNSNKEITFVMSPGYLFENERLVLAGALHKLAWKILIPEYDSAGHEEGLVEWLLRSEIVFDGKLSRIENISLADFIQSIVTTEQG